MFDIFFAMIAAGLSAAPGTPPENGNVATAAPTAAQSPAVQIAPENTVIGQGTIIQQVPASRAPAANATAFNMSVVPAGLVAEPQTPTGKFTTATEIKPILAATKANWVAVRDYDGKDHLYITHLWGWRCGLKAIAISVNDEPMQNWPLPPCHTEFTTPNAILPEDGLPYLRFKQGAVHRIGIQIVYDDLSMDVAYFDRANVLIP